MIFFFIKKYLWIFKNNLEFIIIKKNNSIFITNYGIVIKKMFPKKVTSIKRKYKDINLTLSNLFNIIEPPSKSINV